ncbi:MAG: hypothetical protein GY775_12730 [Candidatus Scalindua sp.]|nr:hypothetical protein [Candidatus Scalindua sp.]
MNAEIVNGLINIGLSLCAALIGWDIIPINLPEEKKEKWNKAKPIVKWCGTIATIIFTILFIFKIA